MLDGSAIIQRERVSDEIYVFTSDLYAQVTAGAIVTTEGAALIDTLAFPQETRQIKHFIEEELNTPVRYIINTHYHADHTYGNCLFPNARIIGHRRCRDLQLSRGIPALAQAKRESRDLADIELLPPTTVFDRGQLTLTLAGISLTISHVPGHSPDSINVLVNEERVLFAGDSMMPLPFFVDGDLDDYISSISPYPDMGLENIVQGHGEIILRGEIDERIKTDIDYLRNIRQRVQEIVDAGGSRDDLANITIESAGKSRLPLAGAVVQLHQGNLAHLYDLLSQHGS